MHGEKVMAKKSKPPVKWEKAVVKEEAPALIKEETPASGKEGEGIDFFYILAGGGVLLVVIFIGFLLLRYVLHVI